MTMFSMKPKFDLAEFLAEPASKGGAKSRRGRGVQFKSSPLAKADSTADTAKSPKPAAETK